MSTQSSRLAVRSSLLPPNVSGYGLSKGLRKHMRRKIPAEHKAQEERARNALLQKRQSEPAAPAKVVAKKTAVAVAPKPHSSLGTWNCNECGENNDSGDTVCWDCGEPCIGHTPPKSGAVLAPGNWVCKNWVGPGYGTHQCGTVNGTNNVRCKECDAWR